MLETKRKNIDIKAETFRALSIKAAANGTNLKKYIEQILDTKAAEEEDLYLFNKHVKDNEACWIPLDKEEQAAFEKELGL